jgi:hypothetical protein
VTTKTYRGEAPLLQRICTPFMNFKPSGLKLRNDGNALAALRDWVYVGAAPRRENLSQPGTAPTNA